MLLSTLSLMPSTTVHRLTHNRCTEPRALDYAGVPDMTTDQAWEKIKTASKERDIDDFKTVRILLPLLP